MVRTYATVNSTTSRVGELFDFVFNESQRAASSTSSASNKLVAAPIQSRPVSDISLTTDPNRPDSVPLEPRASGGWTRGVESPSTHPMRQHQPLSLARDEAVFVDDQRNPRRRNPSYYDYERQMREQDRQQRQAYLRDLQRQLEEQREQRLRTEIAFGGHEFETEFLKHQLRERRGAYSASNGFTGSSIDKQNRNGIGFGYGLGNGDDYEKYLRAADLQHKREYASALQQQNQQYRFRPTGGYTPTFVSDQSNFSPYIRRERSVPDNLNLFQQTPALNYDREISRRPVAAPRRQPWQDEPVEVYDPWGKGGAGAPIRDRNGRLVTDRRQLQKSWHSMLDSNLPHDSSQNRGTLAALHQYNAQQAQSSSTFGQPPPAAMSEHDYYKEELRKQIEEQKRLRELEKEKERLEDERDRLRVEREAERQRREVEEERRKQQQKAERGLRRVEMAQARTGALSTTDQQQQPVKNGVVGGKRSPPDDGLEWWERQPLMSRSNSANDVSNRRLSTPKATTASTANFDADDPSTVFPNRAVAVADSSRVKPPLDRRVTTPPPSNHRESLSRDRSAVARNEQIMRQLSAMRERLNKEQMRVRSAIRRRDYSDDLFEDQDRVGSANGHRSRHGQRQSESKRPENADDEDPPLVKLIKNSRTFDSAALRSPPPVFGHYGSGYYGHLKNAQFYDENTD